jgi:hypothetical protein
MHVTISCRHLIAASLFVRWQLMSDVSYKAWFVGSACTLCKDSAWTVQQKALQ